MGRCPVLPLNAHREHRKVFTFSPLFPYLIFWVSYLILGFSGLIFGFHWITMWGLRILAVNRGSGFSSGPCFLPGKKISTDTIIIIVILDIKTADDRPVRNSH